MNGGTSRILVICIFVILIALSRSTSDNLKGPYQSVNSHGNGFNGKATRYFLYDVNPGEGFNLRRDVYIRAATFVKRLNENDPKVHWVLVLPPWGPLYHWKNHGMEQEPLPWSTFFDVESLNEYVPVVEFHQFLKETKEATVDRLFHLENFDFSKIDLQSEWLLEEINCQLSSSFKYHWEKIPSGGADGRSYNNSISGMIAKKGNCFQALGRAADIADIKKMNRLFMFMIRRSVMVDRFETVLHDHFGDEEYWEARKSMKFAEYLLKDYANPFMKDYLRYDAKSEIDVLQNRRKGGSYIGVHLRRQDFLSARADEVPSIKDAAAQIREVAEEYRIHLVYIATDGTDLEFQELRDHTKGLELHRFVPNSGVLETITDGGVAIVDQWICANARVFVGSFESAFSFRIQEERETLGFPPQTTFRRLCKHANQPCTQPTQWRMPREHLHTEL